MSAFVVDHAHIDALVTYAVANNVSYYDAAAKERVDITRFNATEVGRILLTENERSVLHRYPDCGPGNMPGKIGEEASGYKFRQFNGQTVATILKGCDCFDYQACETDDYEASVAHTIINSIRRAAVRHVPGYEAAPWGIRR